MIHCWERWQSVVHELEGLTKKLYLYSPVHIDIFPHAKIKFHRFYGYFMVIELRFFKKNKKMNMAKM